MAPRENAERDALFGPSVVLEEELLRKFVGFSIAVVGLAMAAPVHAAQLSTDARGAIPHDVQQLVVIDYRAMQNSSSAATL